MTERQQLANVAESFAGEDRIHLLFTAFYGSDEMVTSDLYEADEKLENRR